MSKQWLSWQPLGHLVHTDGSDRNGGKHKVLEIWGKRLDIRNWGKHIVLWWGENTGWMKFAENTPDYWEYGKTCDSSNVVKLYWDSEENRIIFIFFVEYCFINILWETLRNWDFKRTLENLYYEKTQDYRDTGEHTNFLYFWETNP